MQTGGDVFKLLIADLHGAFGLRDRNFGQADGDFGTAYLRAGARSNPLQGGCTACVEADPLILMTIYGDGHAHSTGPELERQRLAAVVQVIRFEDTKGARLEIDLNDPRTKEVCAKQ